jgi:hypothetical protein
MARWPLIRPGNVAGRPEKETMGSKEQATQFSFREPLLSLNLGVHYYYQIDTVDLLQTGIYKSFFDAGQAWCSRNIRLAQES